MLLYQHLPLWPFLVLLGTRCAAVTVSYRMSTTVIGSQHPHVFDAVPGQEPSSRATSYENDIELPVTTPKCICRLTTPAAIDSSRYLPCSIIIKQPASTTGLSLPLAAGWNSPNRSIATVDPLANATSTLQAPSSGPHVASSLPHPDHTTATFFGQDIYHSHNNGRQMSDSDLGPNNDLGPSPITNSDARPTTASMDDGVSGIISAIGNGASAAITTRPEQPTATNALSVLLAALPSDVRSSIVSQFDATQTFTTSTRTASPTSIRPPTTSAPSSVSTSTRASSTSSTPAATTTAAPPTDAQQISNGTIAGVATGVVAGAVLIILGIVLLIRRRRQGQAPFGRHGSQRSRGSGRAYPEVAWLYDPSPSPPNEPSHHRGESGAYLLAQNPRTPEMTARGSPHLQPVGPDSPLLPPHVPFARSQSPGASPGPSPDSSRNSSPQGGGRRSVRSSMNSNDPRRPLHIISEESHAQ